MPDYTHYPQLIRAVENTQYVPVCAPDDEVPAPVLAPLEYAPPVDALHAVDQFIEQVQNINEKDYGDFMRKANSYLCRLKEALEKFNLHVDKNIYDMQYYLQFRPNWKPQPTQQRLLKDALWLRTIIVNKLHPEDAARVAALANLNRDRSAAA